MGETAVRKGMSAGGEGSQGTRPVGAAGEADASRKVREMFTRIAPRYDLLNHLLSLHIDRLWRARTARILQPILDRPDARILDLCCGTGDLGLALQRKAKGRVWGADFAHAMLVRAKRKAEEFASRPLKVESERPNRETRRPPADTTGWRIPFVESDALRMPFADASFDLVTAAFGFRNLANYEAGWQQSWNLRSRRPDGSAISTGGISGQCCPGWAGSSPGTDRHIHTCRHQ